MWDLKNSPSWQWTAVCVQDFRSAVHFCGNQIGFNIRVSSKIERNDNEFIDAKNRPELDNENVDSL